MGSWLQFGDHPPMSCHRSDPSFEEHIQKCQMAKQTFITADARRRILRAQRGKARKQTIFQVGELVYFFRKGKNATSRSEPGE